VSNTSTLAKESVKGLGPSAYLVTVLPSAVFVLTLFALFSSQLYPWANPAPGHAAPGPAAVVETARQLGPAGGAVLLLTVLVVAVLLRPFQVTLVQILEGYWSHRSRGIVQGFAIERHRRRLSRFGARKDPYERGAELPDLAEVAAYGRRQHRADRLRNRSTAVLDRYPRDPELVMPTLLGNVLRRAESTAGERYGLGTVVTYPRLYPHLSARLDAEVSEQVDVLDTTATFTLLLWTISAIAAPLLLRHDGWSLLPLVLAALARVTYLGAQSAASRYGTLLCAAYDLHRFDLLRSLRFPLPLNPSQELAGNQWLTQLLTEEIGPAEAPSPVLGWRYRHSETDSARKSALEKATTDAPPADETAKSEKGTHSDEESVLSDEPDRDARSPVDEDDLSTEAHDVDD